jgi:hypothetical protein
MEKTVELKINPMRIMTTVITAAAFIGVIVGVSHWVFRAETSHDNTNKLTNIVEQLNQQQVFERKLWGDSYEQRISDILEAENSPTNTE